MDVHRVGGRHTFGLAAPSYYRRRLRATGFDLMIEDLNKVPLFSPAWSGSPVVLLVHHLFGGTAFQEATAPVAAATWLLERPLSTAYREVPVEAVSESTAADLVARGFDRSRITVIPNGVDTSVLRPDPTVSRARVPTLLYLGRLKRYKRVDLIVQALERLRRDGVEARLIVVGRGDAEPALRRQVARLGLGDRVELAGFVPEAEKLRLLRTAWVHVLTSPKEGWGIANLEAAACATPTVASDSPGLRDSVVDGETGFLVRHGDVDGLAAAIRRLLEDPDLRARLGRQARAFAERHTWERSADLTERHLESVLRSGAGAPGARTAETPHTVEDG